jgi:hypothetical protein
MFADAAEAAIRNWKWTNSIVLALRYGLPGALLARRFGLVVVSTTLDG